MLWQTLFPLCLGSEVVRSNSDGACDWVCQRACAVTSLLGGPTAAEQQQITVREQSQSVVLSRLSSPLQTRLPRLLAS